MEELNFNVIKLPVNYIIFIIAFAAACVIVVYVIAPKYREIKLKKIEMALIEKNIESKELLYSRIARNADDSMNDEMYNDNIKKINQMISDRNNYEDYLINLVELSKIRNIMVGDFSISGSNEESGNNANKNISEKKVGNNEKTNIIAESISFTAIGGYYGFYEFLRDIEKNIPLLNIDSVKISAEKEGNEEAQPASEIILTYSVKLSYYHY